jgi:hypothetical protein
MPKYGKHKQSVYECSDKCSDLYIKGICSFAFGILRMNPITYKKAVELNLFYEENSKGEASKCMKYINRF